MTILLLSIWLILSAALWIFATSSTINEEKFKHLEFKIKSVFYWISVIASLLIGIAI